MMSRVLSNSILEYYNKYKDNKIIIINNSINEMFGKLQNGEIDIIISKKVDEKIYNNEEVNFIKVGDLQDVIIMRNSSNQTITKDWTSLNNKVIYIPRNDSLSIHNFLDALNKNNVKPIIKEIDSNTMIQLVKNSEDYGFITKQYIEDEIKNRSITIMDLPEFNAEFGIYIKKDHNFKELNNFIKILKHNF